MTAETGMDNGLTDALVRSRRFFTKGTVSDDLRTLTKEGGRDADAFYRDRWSHDKVVRSTHGVNCTGLLLVEGLRQGRDHHLGDPADRLPVGGAGQPGVRAARLPPRRGVLLVHLLADPGPLPLRPRRAAADVPRGQVPARRRPGQGLGAHRRQPAARQGLQVRARQGRPGPRHLGRGDRDGRRGLRPHDPEVGPRPGRGLLADPRDVDGLARLRRPVHLAGRRLDAVVLRLVRRPAGRLAPGVRRPDRRPGVGRLVGRRLPDHVGLQRPGDPHAGRALDDRGPLPRPEGRRGRARLRRQREVRRRVAGDRARHRRRAGDVDGPRHPQGVLRRPADAVLHRLHEEVHRPALPGRPRAPARTAADLPGRQVPHRRRPARARRRGERPLQDRPPRRADRRAGGAQRLARPPVRRRRRRQVEPRPRRRRPAAEPARAGRRDRVRRAAALRRRRRDAGLAAPRRAGAPGRRPAGHHRLRPDARPVRRRPGRARRRLRHVVRRRDARRTPRPGRRRSPASRPRPPPGSPASSRRTPRSPRAAR